MSIISDVTGLVAKVTVDFETGSYGSLVQDLSDGLGLVAALLKDQVGFKGCSPCDPDESCKLDEAIAKAKACKCCKTPVAAAAEGTTAFDPTAYFSIFEQLLTLVAAIRSLIKPAVPVVPITPAA